MDGWGCCDLLVRELDAFDRMSGVRDPSPSEIREVGVREARLLRVYALGLERWRRKRKRSSSASDKREGECRV
jgi:hypothetical protein